MFRAKSLVKKNFDERWVFNFFSCEGQVGNCGKLIEQASSTIGQQAKEYSASVTNLDNASWHKAIKETNKTL